MKKGFLKYIGVLASAIVLINCSKDGGSSGGGNNGGGDTTGGGTTGGSKDTNCVLAAISQVNSGIGSESSLAAYYNSNYEVTKLIIYDSVNNTKSFEADLNYITADSIIIDQYQYFILDANGRVIRFKTKSDLSDLTTSDDYLYEYTYNNDGYLSTRNLYINGSLSANLSTAYTYINNLLMSCKEIAVSSGNLKVLESTLTYNTSLQIRNWIYTFPDATQEYMYLTALNFGKRPANPLTQVVTKIYDPPSGTLLDTWTTSYSNYRVDAYGYVLSGEANGDLQQGIACFYGKTNFYYDCH